MKIFSLVLASLSFSAMATPPELGTYEGILMTGASLYQTVTIVGGNLTGCTPKREAGRAIQACELTSAKLVIQEGNNPSEVTFKRAAVYEPKEDSRIYYYGGTRTVTQGNDSFTQNVRLTISTTPSDVTRIKAILTLTDSDLKSAIEAVLKK